MIGILAIVVVLGGLIFFHELGHFLAARALGIGVKTFSIGFGPRLFSLKRGKTVYQVAAVPLGGYVSMVGEGAADDIPAPFTAEESFSLRPPQHRLLVVLAGPVFNLLLAWLIYWVLLASGGHMLLPEVGGMLENSPAAQAGIKEGDLLSSINGHAITWWDDIPFRVNTSKTPQLDVSVKRPSTARPLAESGHEAEAPEMHFTITPQVIKGTTEKGKEYERRLIGISPAGAYYDGSFFSSALEGLKETWRKTVFTGDMLGMLFSGDIPPSDIGGPVLIAQVVHNQATHSGFWSVLALAALLSINLGLLNLLPIPALDGGHVFFALVELIARRPIPEKVQEYGTYVGLSLLIMLMVFATGNDIYRWIFS